MLGNVTCRCRCIGSEGDGCKRCEVKPMLPYDPSIGLEDEVSNSDVHNFALGLSGIRISWSFAWRAFIAHKRPIVPLFPYNVIHQEAIKIMNQLLEHSTKSRVLSTFDELGNPKVRSRQQLVEGVYSSVRPKSSSSYRRKLVRIFLR